MQSDKIDVLAKALCNVQKEALSAIKGTENKFFKSKYADLNAVWTVAKKPLTDNGFSVTQPTRIDPNNGTFFVETILMHDSGQWIKGQYLIKPDKETPQGYGSAMTYARRYSFAAIVGVVTEDDDGEGGMDRDKEKKELEKKKKEEDNKPDPSVMTVTQRTEIINKGLEINESITQKEVKDAMAWYIKKTGIAKGTIEVYNHAMKKPGIENIYEQYIASQIREPGDES
jgi:hypothetical protein